MSNKDVVTSVQEIKPGKEEAIREHFDIKAETRDALQDQLRDEGIYIESLFIDEREDGAYLCSYIKAENWQQMVEEWRNSDAEEAVVLKDFLDETIVGGWRQFHQRQMENIFHIEVPPQGDLNE